MGAPQVSSPSPSESESESAFPQELGRYTIIGTLASGGMAKVCLGRQSGAAGFERIVAIKCPHESLRTNLAFVEMFLNEARLAARIHHPNVVATLDVSDGDPLYLVMEYVEGGSLSAIGRKARTTGARVPIEMAVRIMTDALAGLHAAHECRGPDDERLGLVHCDISPQNILVGIDGSARITDFGIARASAHVTPEDKGMIGGKLGYMAPELLSSGDVTQRSDVFAAGVVFWELVTGRSLFKGRGGDWATINAVLREPIPAPSSIAPAVPKALDEVLLRALERDPAARYPSAGEFLAALEQAALPAATARQVGDFVKSQVGASALASQCKSGRYRKQPAAARTPVRRAPAARPIVESPSAAPTGVIANPLDMPTRVFEPPAELVAAAMNEIAVAATSERAMPDAYRSRRLVVAIVLILVGCACGLLFAQQAVAPAGARAAAPPAIGAPSAPAHP